MDWPNFPEEELRCHCGCGRCEMDEEFMAWLVNVRREFGRPMIISSGFRCVDYDVRLTGQGENRLRAHARGVAVDVVIAGPDARTLHDIATRNAVLGLGVHQCGPWDGRYLHLDRLRHDTMRPRLWSY